MTGSMFWTAVGKPAELACAAIVAASILCPAAAMAQSTVAGNMTCSQAVATFEKTGRIPIISLSGQSLTLSNGVPMSQRSSLRCGREKMNAAYILKTRDNPRCAVFAHCD